MGISRDSRHKRRATGGKRPQNTKKRNYHMGRPSSMTKLGPKRVHVVRTRGGNRKYRGLRLEAGNFSWASETVTRKTRIVDVVYNSSSNELVRTKTLVKGCIVQIDATPFRQWYEAHFGTSLRKKAAEGKKKDTKKDAKEAAKKKEDEKKDKKGKKEEKKDEKKTEGEAAPAAEEATSSKKKSRHVLAKIASRKDEAKIDQQLIDQFQTGRLYAVISSRPGQSGRCDGYILEGQELAFYLRKLKSK